LSCASWTVTQCLYTDPSWGLPPCLAITEACWLALKEEGSCSILLGLYLQVPIKVTYNFSPLLVSSSKFPGTRVSLLGGWYYLQLIREMQWKPHDHHTGISR
jgi:hypothetical protein